MTDKSCQRCGADVEDINHIIFMCPPAFQCWLLSSISTSPGVFPSTSLFANFDYLLNHAQTATPQAEDLSTFPWLIWYVWKARNEKCINAKDISSLDTLQLARQEAEAWRVAQAVDTLTSIDEDRSALGSRPEQTDQRKRFLCQVDASWVEKEDWMGMGFVLLEENVVILQGQSCVPRTQSPLHAEAEGLSWALREVYDRGFDGINFTSDYQQLVNLINKNEDWPALVPELDDINLLIKLFQKISLSFISRSINLRADSLAKGGRSRAQCFNVVDVLVRPRPALAVGLNEPRFSIKFGSRLKKN